MPTQAWFDRHFGRVDSPEWRHVTRLAEAFYALEQAAKVDGPDQAHLALAASAVEKLWIRAYDRAAGQFLRPSSL